MALRASVLSRGLLQGLVISGLISSLMLAGTAALAQAPADANGAGAKNESQAGLKIEYPPVRPLKTPFPPGGKFGRVSSLEFRALDAMSAEDKAAAEGAQTEIARRAELQGFHLNEGAGWGYEQAVCPAFPEHVILEYSKLDGPGDVTLFSAVVPRGSEGHVRVIPVRRRGYSLWTPASSNALTVNDFNHMVQEGGLSPDSHPNDKDPSLGAPDWMTLSLCYTALAAGHVRAALIPQLPSEEQYPLAAPPMMTVGDKKGGAEVRMVDTAMPKPKGEWILEYDAAGHLKKVKKVQPTILKTEAVAGPVDLTPAQ